MEHFFKNIFSKRPKEEENTDYQHTSPERIRELLGIRSFESVSDEKLKELFKTDDLMSAYQNLYTTTGETFAGDIGKIKAGKIEAKKGNVREILMTKMISEEILKNLPTVYLGSGADIEYPLAIGSRKIVMFDPIFKNQESKKELIDRIEKIINEKLSDGLTNDFSFLFDFGNGDELVEVKIIPEYYTKKTSTELPKKVGLVIMFASQDGQYGRIAVEDNLEKKIVDGGAILTDHAFTIIKNGRKEVTELGK